MLNATDRRRVLVVDDDRTIADTLVMILQKKEFDVRVAYSGEEAAQAALTFKPDAMIADVIMGPMDGVALAVYLAQSLPACKVLLVSGHMAAAQLLEESRTRGYDFELLAKPVHPDRILEFLIRPAHA